MTYRIIHLAAWFWSWLLYSANIAVALAALSLPAAPPEPALLALHQAATLGAGLLLAFGLYRFLGRPLAPVWWIAATAVALWIPVASLARAPFPLLVAPSCAYVGAISVITGLSFLRTRAPIGGSRHLVGWPFIVWGLHNLDYPLLRPLEWVAPWGYLLSAVCGLVAAFGLVLAYFEQARQALAQQNRFTNAVLEALPLGILVVPEGRFDPLYFNPALLRISGWPPETLQHGRLIESLFPDSAEADRAAAQIGTRMSATSRLEDLEIVTRSGGRRMVEVTSIPIPDQGIRVLAVRDRTDEKRMQQDLAAANEALRTLIDASPLAIYDLGPDGTVLSIWNQAAERLFGWRRDEVLGRRIPSVPPEEQRDFQELLSGVFRGERFTGRQVERMRKDGTRITVSLAAAPLATASGIAAAIAVAEDVTGQRRLQAQFIQAQKMETLGRLAGGIAHDFNNLLTVISGYAEALLADLPEGSPSRPDLEEILRTASRATQLTSQLLAFSRQQASQPRPTDLNELVGGMRRMLQRLLGENVELVLEQAEGLWPVHVDANQIEQVLANLAVNAHDAMPNGGTLTIRTANVRIHGGEADPPGLAGGEYVRVEVIDTGMGMDQNVMSHLFEPFFTTKEPGKGTGLGLSTCYGIVRQHGGDIRVQSSPGRGSAFSIYLPRGQGQAQPIIEGGPRALARGSGTVLVVEDEESLRRLLVRTLERGGYTPLEARDGEEAWVLLATHAVDLIVTDMVMPRMSGVQLAQRVLARDPSARLLFISGYGETSAAAQLRNSPRCVFVHKPFTPTELLERVREIMHRPDEP